MLTARSILIDLPNQFGGERVLARPCDLLMFALTFEDYAHARSGWSQSPALAPPSREQEGDAADSKHS